MVSKKPLDEIVEAYKVSRTFTLLDDQGNPIDISNYEVFYTIKKDKNDEEVVLQTVNEPGDHSDPTNGETVLEFSASDTRGIVSEDRDLQYDIGYIDDNGDRVPVFIGKQPVLKGVTDEV